MWERMSASEGGKGLSVDFLSTHPANAKRIKQLENWMPEVSPLLSCSAILFLPLFTCELIIQFFSLILTETGSTN